MKKIRAAALFLCLTFIFSGCGAAFVKKDSLVFIENETDENSGILTLEVTSFTDEAHALLLYYDPELKAGIYTERDTSGAKPVSYLYLYDENGEQLLFSGANAYTYAYIDPYDKSIYFKEYDQNEASAALYKTDFSVSSKTLVTMVSENRALPCAAAEGAVVYVDSVNNIILEKDGKSNIVISLLESSTVKKIAYSPTNNVITALVSISQRSSILYLVNAENGELTQLDAGVSDFSHEEKQNKLHYVKSAGGSDQLYAYNYQAALRSLLYTGSIDRFSVSPKGSYVAFCTRATVDSPGQSVWLLTISNRTAVQMTANTAIAGSMYFASGKRLLFSEIDTHNPNTAYITKNLEFKLVYSDKEKK